MIIVETSLQHAVCVGSQTDDALTPFAWFIAIKENIYTLALHLLLCFVYGLKLDPLSPWYLIKMVSGKCRFYLQQSSIFMNLFHDILFLHTLKTCFPMISGGKENNQRHEIG